MIKADLHIHSALSPCGGLEMSPAAIVRQAKDLGLDVIAVTDHNSLENSFYAASAGRKIGIHVLYGMEAQTSEEFHVLCYLPDLKQAEKFQAEIYGFLPDVPNNPEYFGDQVVVDEADNIVCFQKKLLLNSLSLSINELYDTVRCHGGCMIPAHVESDQFGLLTVLGFVPGELNFRTLEISYCTAAEKARERFPELKDFFLVSHSDAHYLKDIGRACTVTSVGGIGFDSLFNAYFAGNFSLEYMPRRNG